MEDELKMVRCIDTKNGKEKFMPESLVKDKRLMSQYNLKVQDLKVTKQELEEAENVGEEEDVPVKTLGNKVTKKVTKKEAEDGISE